MTALNNRTPARADDQAASDRVKTNHDRFRDLSHITVKWSGVTCSLKVKARCLGRVLEVASLKQGRAPEDCYIDAGYEALCCPRQTSRLPFGPAEYQRHTGCRLPAIGVG